MPSYDAVAHAAEALEAEGRLISIENVRLKIGGSTRDIAPLLRRWKAEQAPPTAPTPEDPTPALLTLHDLRTAAGRCLFHNLTPDCVQVLAALRLDLRHPPVTEWDIWFTLREHLSDQADRQVVTWQMARLGGGLVWTQGGESARLHGLWHQYVVEPARVQRERQRAAVQRQQWARLAQRQLARYEQHMHTERERG